MFVGSICVVDSIYAYISYYGKYIVLGKRLVCSLSLFGVDFAVIIFSVFPCLISFRLVIIVIIVCIGYKKAIWSIYYQDEGCLKDKKKAMDSNLGMFGWMT